MAKSGGRKRRPQGCSLRSHRLRRLKPLTPTLSPATHSAIPSMLPCCTSDLKRRLQTSLPRRQIETSDQRGNSPDHPFADPRSCAFRILSAGSRIAAFRLSAFQLVRSSCAFTARPSARFISEGHRFDDPQQVFGVCYVARTREGAFAEPCLRVVGTQFVATAFLEARSFIIIETVKASGP